MDTGAERRGIPWYQSEEAQTNQNTEGSNNNKTLRTSTTQEPSV